MFKKDTMKRPLIILLVISLLSTSCSVIHWDEEFGDVVGTWVNPPLTEDAIETLPINNFMIQSWTIKTIFDKNLTGRIDKESSQGDYESDSFKYNIKGNTLTITFDEESANNRYVISGVNTHTISDHKLTIIGEDGIITVLTKHYGSGGLL